MGVLEVLVAVCVLVSLVCWGLCLTFLVWCGFCGFCVLHCPLSLWLWGLVGCAWLGLLNLVACGCVVGYAQGSLFVFECFAGW